MTQLIFIPILIAVIVVNFYWYRMKAILKDNGYKVNYWHSHFGDILNFFDLIKIERDPLKKFDYKKIVWTALVAMILFVTMSISVFIMHL